MELARKAGDASDFRRRADDLVKQAVGWDFAVWSTVDPPTMLFTSCTVLGVQRDESIERQLFELEFAGDDVNLFADLALGDRPAGSLNIATGGNPAESRRFRELLREVGCGDELRAVFKVEDSAWGSLVAYRSTHTRPFSEENVALVSQIGPAVAEGLRQCFLWAAAEAPHRLKDGPGLLLMAEDGRVREVTPMAERWMSLVDPTHWSTALRSLAARTKAGGSTTSLPLQAQTGQWVVLHGSPTDSGAVAIIVEEARDIHLTKVVSGLYGLTARERVVAEHVLQGRSTKEISLILRISPYTVQDHLKSIFDKVGVRSRRELVSLFFNQHYLERRRAASIPGPYGWYLDDEGQ